MEVCTYVLWVTRQHAPNPWSLWPWGGEEEGSGKGQCKDVGWWWWCGPSNLMDGALCRDSDYRRLMMDVGRVVPGPIAMSDVGARQCRGKINQQGGGRLPGWRRGTGREKGRGGGGVLWRVE